MSCGWHRVDTQGRRIECKDGVEEAIKCHCQSVSPRSEVSKFSLGVQKRGPKNASSGRLV